MWVSISIAKSTVTIFDKMYDSSCHFSACRPGRRGAELQQYVQSQPAASGRLPAPARLARPGRPADGRVLRPAGADSPRSARDGRGSHVSQEHRQTGIVFAIEILLNCDYI